MTCLALPPPVAGLNAAEIAVAQEIQAAFLRKGCPECAGVRVATRHRMSRGVGGDLYDFVPGVGQRYSLVIGDVVGHELFSALVMSLIIGAVRAAARKVVSPVDVASLVNDLLCDLNEQLHSRPLLCSLFFGIVDPVRHRLTYANAGHPAAIAWRRDGGIEELHATGSLLGLARNSDFLVDSLGLNHVEHLLLYTDGVSDARDRDDRFFDKEGIINAVSHCRHRGVERALDCVVEEVFAFADGWLADDMTLVLADYRNTQEN
jgi:sigma-B regulation protein RsbU (phosphoserine phosphatase)